jgi:hypothetical protein
VPAAATHGIPPGHKFGANVRWQPLLSHIHHTMKYCNTLGPTARFRVLLLLFCFKLHKSGIVTVFLFGNAAFLSFLLLPLLRIEKMHIESDSLQNLFTPHLIIRRCAYVQRAIVLVVEPKQAIFSIYERNHQSCKP